MVHGVFRRLRILCGGQIVEDINEYNRLHEMFHIMKPPGQRTNDGIEGFGDDEILYVNDTRTVCFTPMSGLLRQEKYLPIRYTPLQLELEVVSSGDEFVNKVDASHQSESFKLSDIQLKCDLVTLDNTLDNEYAHHLFSGKHYQPIAAHSPLLHKTFLGPLRLLMFLVH